MEVCAPFYKMGRKQEGEKRSQYISELPSFRIAGKQFTIGDCPRPHVLIEHETPDVPDFEELRDNGRYSSGIARIRLTSQSGRNQSKKVISNMFGEMSLSTTMGSPEPRVYAGIHPSNAPRAQSSASPWTGGIRDLTTDREYQQKQKAAVAPDKASSTTSASEPVSETPDSPNA